MSSQLFISDGSTATTYGSTNFKFSERLKVRCSPGKWILRYFSVFLENSTAEYMIKIDPDAEPIQKMRIPLTGDATCAKLPVIEVDRNAFHPHAGVIGFSRKYVHRVVSSGLLSSDALNLQLLGDREELVLRRLFKKTHANVMDRADFCCGTCRNKRFNAKTCSFWHY